MCCMHVKLISMYSRLSIHCVALIIVNPVPSQAITINYIKFLVSLSPLPSPSLCRYQLYGHWKNDTYDKHPELISAKTETLSRGRYMMK